MGGDLRRPSKPGHRPATGKIPVVGRFYELPRSELDRTECYCSAVPTAVNLALALVPTAWIAVKQTTTIKASITAYSTAVGPSSETRKLRMQLVKVFIASPTFTEKTFFSGVDTG